MPLPLVLTHEQIRAIRDEVAATLPELGELFERLREEQRVRFGFPPGEVEWNFGSPTWAMQQCRRGIESIDAGEADASTLISLVKASIQLGHMAAHFTALNSKASHQRSGTAQGRRTAAALRNSSQMRAAWASGKFATHSECAEAMAPDLHISVRQARKYLNGLKRPKRPK